MAGLPRSKQQMQGPLYRSALEMGNTPAALLDEPQRHFGVSYRDMFRQAFPEDPAEQHRTEPGLRGALTAFETSLVSLNSRYDYYAHGFHESLTEDEIEGMNVFRSFVARCGECHTPPLFSNQQIAVLGTPEPEGRPLDPGAGPITGVPSQRAGFKVPSLAQRGERPLRTCTPVAFETLREAVAFYTGGRGSRGARKARN